MNISEKTTLIKENQNTQKIKPKTLEQEKSILNEKVVVKQDKTLLDLSKLSSLGKSTQKISFVNSSAPEPLINIPGVKAGDTFFVDGPGWYNGEATLKKYDQNVMEFDISMKAAKKILGMETNIPYEIKNGKVSLSVKLEKGKDNEYILTTTDHNKSSKKYTQKVKSDQKGNTHVMTDNYGNKTTFIVKGKGNMSIKTAGAPFTIDLSKN